ncbi:MAG: DUF3298 and DUF4163 domain-containing protein [Chitinophagales bacterium]
MKKLINVKCYYLIFLLLSLIACQDPAKQTDKNSENSIETNIDAEKPTTTVAVEPVQNLPQQFYKRLEGNIASDPIIMHLIRIDTLLSGNFFYKKEKNIFSNAESTINRKAEVKIAAYNQNTANNIVLAGMFESKFVNTARLEGTWNSKKTGDNSKLFLEEKYAVGSVPLHVINFEKELDCDEQEACASMKLNFPRIKKAGNEELANTMNATINKYLLEMLNDLASNPDETAANSIEEATAAFFNSFTEYGEQYGQMWSNEIDWEIHNNEHHILSFALNKYYYMGGAHPNYMSKNFNFDLNNGKVIQLTDIFEDNYKVVLEKLAEKELRMQQDIPPNAPLTDFLFETELKLNENFYLTLESITFIYDPYEIAPYAFGTITLPIAFKDIKHIIKKDGLLGKMMK